MGTPDYFTSRGEALGFLKHLVARGVIEPYGFKAAMIRGGLRKTHPNAQASMTAMSLIATLAAEHHDQYVVWCAMKRLKGKKL